MAIVKLDCCKCDVCGYVWYAKASPKQCSKCKSRAWNGGLIWTPQCDEVLQAMISHPPLPMKELVKRSKAKAKTEPYSVKPTNGKMSDAEYKAMLRDKVKLKT